MNPQSISVHDIVTTLRYYDERIEKGERLYRASLRADREARGRVSKIADDTALLVGDAVLVDWTLPKSRWGFLEQDPDKPRQSRSSDVRAFLDRLIAERAQWQAAFDDARAALSQGGEGAR